MTERTNYLVWPDDTVEELVGDDTYLLPMTFGLYQRLLDAGYPKNGPFPNPGSEFDAKWAEVLDFSVGADGDVIAYTSGKEPHECQMDERAALVFTSWLAEHGRVPGA